MKLRITDSYYRGCFEKGEIVTIGENLKVTGSLYGNYTHAFKTKKN